MKRTINYEIINMTENERRLKEFEACQYFKKIKDSKG